MPVSISEVCNTIAIDSFMRELSKYARVQDIARILNMYFEKHRHYHNWKHIASVVNHIRNRMETDMLMLSDARCKRILYITAFIHDAVYNTHSTTNEEDSAELVELFNIDEEEKKIIRGLVVFTHYRTAPSTPLEQFFADADLDIFNAPADVQIEFENAIFKEYYWVPIPYYVSERIKILKHLKNTFGCDTEFLQNYLISKKWNVGFYPGTFYPFHVGHKSVLQQSEQMFDKVIIGFGDTKAKTGFQWNDDEYGKLNEWVHANYETIQLGSLITNDIAEIKKYAGSVTLIRGLRNGTDLIYEQNYLQTLRDFMPDVKAAYFMTEPKHAHISSSLIREVLKLSPKDAYNYYKL